MQPWPKSNSGHYPAEHWIYKLLFQIWIRKQGPAKMYIPSLEWQNRGKTKLYFLVNFNAWYKEKGENILVPCYLLTAGPSIIFECLSHLSSKLLQFIFIWYKVALNLWKTRKLSKQIKCKCVIMIWCAASLCQWCAVYEMHFKSHLFF